MKTNRFIDILNRLNCDAAEFARLTGVSQHTAQQYVDGVATISRAVERIAELLVLDADEGGSWARKNLHLIANRLQK